MTIDQLVTAALLAGIIISVLYMAWRIWKAMHEPLPPPEERRSSSSDSSGLQLPTYDWSDGGDGGSAGPD